MPKNPGGSRLDPKQTKQLLDGYLQYRFRQELGPKDLAKKAGVNSEVTERLLAQQPVDEADLTRVAHALGLTPRLLNQICGFDNMSREMLDTITGFLDQTIGKERAREAH